MKEAGALAKAALAIEPVDASANMAMCWYCMFNEQMENALSAAQVALDSEPNLSVAQIQAGGCLSFLCRPEEAIDQLRKADVMSHRDPWRWLWYMHLGNAHFAAARYDQVITTLNEGAKLRPSWRGFYTIKAAAAGMLGRDAEASDAIKQLLALLPQMSLRGVRHYPLFTARPVIESLLEGLRRAGLPE
jgi:adenylate cyclase